MRGPVRPRGAAFLVETLHEDKCLDGGPTRFERVDFEALEDRLDRLAFVGRIVRHVAPPPPGRYATRLASWMSRIGPFPFPSRRQPNPLVDRSEARRRLTPDPRADPARNRRRYA